MTILKRNMDVYNEVIKEIQINLEAVNSTIKTISEKIQHYNEIQQKNIQEKKSLYTIDSFSFYWRRLKNKWRENILNILIIVQKPLAKSQSDLLVRVLTDLNKEIDIEEDKEESIEISVFKEIYKDNYKMVNIPTQSFESINNLELKIKKTCDALDHFERVSC